MRVLMTGGYGCIGSWVAKQLVEAGHEVWIYDLKEDTHRLDLILEPEQRSLGPFRAPAMSPTSTRAVGRRAGRGDAHPAPGRLADAHLPRPTRSWARRSTSSARWPSSRRPWRSRTRCSGSSMPARRRCTGRRTGRGGRARRRGPPGAAVPLRCVQGLQRAQCPGLLARPRDHQHRPAALDGLRRRTRLRHDQRADQGDQGGRRWAGPTGSATAASRTSSTSATWPRPSCGP